MSKITLSRIACLAIGFSLAGASFLSAQIEYDREAFWSKENIKQSFLNSYALRTEVQPEPTDDEKLLIRGVLELLPVDPIAARAQINAALNSNSTSVLYFIAANFHAEDGNIDEAIADYEVALEKFPNFLTVHKNIGFMKASKQNYEDAITHITRAIELGLEDSGAYGVLGNCYLQLEKYISAESAYRSAYLLDEGNDDWKLGLALVLQSQEKYKESIAMLDEILLDDPENEDIWAFQGNAYLGLEEIENAVANQEIINRLGKASADNLRLMGQVYMSKNLNGLALERFQQAIRQEPNQPADALISTAEIMVARGGFDTATKWIDNIRGNYGSKLSKDENVRLLRLQAQLAFATDQAEKVVPILERLIENDPLDGTALLLLAEHYSKLDTDDGYTRADLYYERVAKISEFELKALLAWARSYVAREQFDKAIPLVEEVAVKDPAEYITRYLEQLRMIQRAQ